MTGSPAAAERARWRLLGAAAAVAALMLDQATKWLVLLVIMDPPRAIPVLPFFDLVLTWNPGVSFGLFADGVPPWLFVLVALAVSGLLAVWIWRAENAWIAAGSGLIVGGALGNVVDRLVHGAVVDFILLHAGGLHWPVFNIADAAITVGVGLVLFDGLFRRKRTPEEGA